jgi:hypothetical protein
MKIKMLIFSLLIILSFNSCDILRVSPFRVTSWSPGNGFHGEPERISVMLHFSNTPDISSVERNFSLTGNGNNVRGIFSWNGNKMSFTPLVPLEKNTDYAINLSADAHDISGLSMDERFTGNFTTRPGGDRPFLLSCYPAIYEEISDPRKEVTLLFSCPVPEKSLQDHVSFSPSMTGAWRLEKNGTLAVFTPSEPWTQHSRYEIRVSASLSDINGMNMGKDFLSVFTAGVDHEKPVLLEAWRLTKDGKRETLLPAGNYSGAAENFTENRGWEREDSLILIFSKPLDVLSVKNYVVTEDAPGLVINSSNDTEFLFKFDNPPVYESRFTIRIKPGIKDVSGNETKEEYVFKIFADGEHSKPPSLAGIRIPLSPGGEPDFQLVSIDSDTILEIIKITDEHYPSGVSVKTWIELYFDTAQDAVIDDFSLMELFRIETSNNVLSFSPHRIKTDLFSAPDPAEGWENYQRIEVGGYLTNSTNFGIVYLIIGTGLKDSLGNKNEKTQKISFIK